MKANLRSRACKVKTIPQKYKFAAYCDTQEATAREDEAAERAF